MGGTNARYSLDGEDLIRREIDLDAVKEEFARYEQLASEIVGNKSQNYAFGAWVIALTEGNPEMKRHVETAKNLFGNNLEARITEALAVFVLRGDSEKLRVCDAVSRELDKYHGTNPGSRAALRAGLAYTMDNLQKQGRLFKEQTPYH